MTALPRPPAPEPSISQALTHSLTVDEFTAFGETEHGRYELQEGNLVMSPSPAPDHAYAVAELRALLKPQMSPTFEVLTELDVNLELVPANQPGFVRRPDLIVVDKAARLRVRAEGGLVRASEVLVVVEIVSPGSRRFDNVIKRGEYADAGIPHYWIVDIDPPVSMVACHLTEEFGYVDDGAVTGSFATKTPFPVELDLDQLR